MYSPTTRLLTVLELLESRGRISGPEIARRLEIDIRTVRRYITILQDMGIPVEAERGPHGAYQLHRGHKLPPLMFTDGEAVALSLGLLAVKQLRFVVDAAAVEGALAKTERVMPENLLRQVRALQETIRFRVPPVDSAQQAFVTLLSTAVQQRQQVCLRYKSGSDESERLFDPYGIVLVDSNWYTAGFCHLRGDLRTFRLDRVVALQPVDSIFERPDDFDVMAHVQSSLRSHRPVTGVEVLLKTSLEQAQEFIRPDVGGTLEVTEAGVVYRRDVYHLDRTAHFLLTLPFPVKILNPPELRDLVRQMAAKAVEMVDDSD